MKSMAIIPTDQSSVPELESRKRVAVETAIMAGIASVPVVGHGLHVALESYIQRTKEERWHTFWRSVEDRLNLLESTAIDLDYFRSPDFYDRLVAVHTQIATSNDSGKIAYLRDYLINCSRNVRPDVSWRDLFLRHIENLAGSHLACLHLFYSTQGQLSEIERFSQISDSAPFDLPMLAARAPDSWDPAFLEVLVSDLESAGLVRRATDRGDPPSLAWSITNTGLRLIAFVTIPELT